MKTVLVLIFMGGVAYFLIPQFLNASSDTYLSFLSSPLSTAGTHAVATLANGTRTAITTGTTNVKNSIQHEIYQLARSAAKQGIQSLSASFGISDATTKDAGTAPSSPTFLSTTDTSAVHNASSSVTFCPLYNKNEDVRYTVRGITYTTTPYTFSVAWGDGERTTAQPLPTGQDLSLTHPYSAAGDYTITLSLFEGGSTYTYDKSVCIR
ncbi:MAG: hypothetical protein KGI50_03980 [Patescibacteria group bacterium]|nr:hypothetical protein [Patescibacteria group bacterium]MDE2438846.1 hypothetical protein [Patescibacteria group bacterium]